MAAVGVAGLVWMVMVMVMMMMMMMGGRDGISMADKVEWFKRCGREVSVRWVMMGGFGWLLLHV